MQAVGGGVQVVAGAEELAAKLEAWGQAARLLLGAWVVLVQVECCKQQQLAVLQ